MSGALYSLAAFVVAVGVLVTVHEFGHFIVARLVGVKVLRFSIGFGKPLWRRQPSPEATEFVIAAIPLGGYVKMVDEREGNVSEADLPHAFNRKPVGSRIAVVLAGPLFNFLFAILAYWLMFASGVPGLKPVIAEPPPESPAAEAGLQARDEILRVDGRETRTWDDAALTILDGLLGGRRLVLDVRSIDDHVRRVELNLSDSGHILEGNDLLREIGLRPYRPPMPAVIDRIVSGGAAERAGLQPGDRILSADGQAIEDWEDWVEYVRARPEQGIEVTVERDGALVELELWPDRVELDDASIGRIGAYVRIPEALGEDLRTLVRYGPLDALSHGIGKTWQMSALTLRTLWKMLLGQASVENLSGPISIAQYAGHSASAGFSAFLGFLAIVSISLGILNLLPIPVLDGGHLLFYAIELVKGSPVSEQAEAFGQRIGIALILALMTLALFNDFARLLR